MKSLFAYVLGAFLSLLIAGCVLKLWRVDWKIPFSYPEERSFAHGDRLFTLALVKGVLENGGYLRNPHLGAPGILEFHDYPRTDHTHLLMIRFLGLFTSHWEIVANLYYLLTFPLITCCSLYVFRRFGISFPAALVCSLLFAFLPYRLGLAQAHLFLVSYFMVPFTCMVALQLASDEEIDRKKIMGAFLICVVQASSGIYHTFFGSGLILIGGMLGGWRTRRFRPALIGACLALVMFITMMVHLSPAILYRFQHGINPEVAQRGAMEAQLFGMQIAKLFLPSEHRLWVFATGFDDPHGYWGYLGLPAITGFAYLLWSAFRFRPTPTLVSSLARLNLAVVLIAVSGGFGHLFAILISPQIRAYNRMSVLIAFLSLLALAGLLENLRGRIKPRFYGVLVSCLLAFGVWDQSVPEFSAYSPEAYTLFHTNRQFVRKIESSLPANAKVFQFPYLPFPEAGAPGRMMPRDHHHGYLHSTTIHWSYGAMEGRSTDEWQRQLVRKPWSEIILELRRAGFSGVYVDRAAYPKEKQERIESALRAILRQNPILSGDGRRIFFAIKTDSLSPNAAKIKNSGID